MILQINIMDRKSCRCLNTVSLIILILRHMGKVQSANNIKIDGAEVYGEPFKLACSTRLINTPNYGSFYRSTNSGQNGTRVGYREFHRTLTPSCIEAPIHTNYTVSCNSDGTMFTLTIPANNTIEHKTYWRCKTDTDNRVLINNVIHIYITVRITGISWISPVVGPDNTVIVTPDIPTTFQCQTTQGRPASNITWHLDNVQLSGGTITTTTVSGDIVITTGSLTLTVNRTADDNFLSCRATNYVNMEPVESTVKPVIIVKCQPEPPPFLISGSPDTNSVSLSWLPGYHGNADQTFHIDFRPVNGSWVKGPDVLGGQIQGQLFNVTVSDLKADTRYTFRISASSTVGSRDLYTYAVTRTVSTIVMCTCSPCNNIGAAVGGSVGGIAIVVVISVFVVWYCRKTGVNERPGSKKSMKRERANIDSSQNEPVSEYYNIGSDIEDRQTTDGSSCYQDLTKRGPVVVPVYQTLDVADT